jgi:zinc protease
MNASVPLLTARLDNGLSVLVQESHSAPVASFWVWYRVGSRNEHAGITGISHWVEHMLFKGTPTFPRGGADAAVAREGGVFNAMTWYDFTAYFATLPAPRIELAVRIEADRMVNSLFDPHEVAAERTVVISERQGNENDPQFVLSEEVLGASFRVHPYGHPTIGHLCDLQVMDREQLYAHYRTYYTPSNAVAIAVGDFEGAEMLKLIEQHLGPLPGSDGPPPVTDAEPVQKGERRVTVEGEGEVAYLQLLHRAPAARHPDFAAMTVLDAILSGPGGMAVFGGVTTNRSSRLYRALVATELATGVSGSLLPTVDPYVYSLSAVVRQGRSQEQVEAAMVAELDRIVSEPVSGDEMQKALKQARAEIAYSSESVTGLARWLGFSEVVADHTWFERYLARLGSVTAEDVQRVAGEVLSHSRRTVGWYIPEEAA